MTITKEGALASFYTVNKAPIKHLRVYFSPKQAGEGTPSPDNVREISGWSGLTIKHTGLNITEFEAASNYFIYYIPQELVNKEMIYSNFIDNTNGSSTAKIRISCRDEKNNGIYNLSRNTSITAGNSGRDIAMLGGSISIPVNTHHIYFGTSGNDIVLKEPMIEFNVKQSIWDLSKYEPYRGQTHTLDWTNDIGTVYGGYVDLVTGELVEEWRNVMLTSDINWQIQGRGTQYADGVYFYNETTDFDKLCLYDAGQYQTINQVEKYTHGTIENAWASKGNHAWVYGSTRATIRLGFDDNMNITSIAELKNWLDAQGNVYVLYPLKNPIHYQLSPTQLSTLIGQNNIWSNADRVEVEYDLAESNDELYRRRNILMRSAPHIETVSGSLAHFETDIAAPIKSAKISFSPVQEGSGDPSPENVRNITGFDGIKVWKSGKNMLDPSTRIVYDSNGESHYGMVSRNNQVPSGNLVLPTGTYTFSISDNTNCTEWRVSDSDEKKYAHQYGKTSAKITMSSTRAVVAYSSIKTSDGLISTRDFQIEYGANATSFEQYNGTMIPIDWQTAAGTIYGGYIDLVTGELVRDWVIDTHEIGANDGTPGGAGTGGNTNYRFIAWNLASAHLPDSDRKNQAVCNILPYDTEQNGSRYWIGGGTVYMILPNDEKSYSVTIAYPERPLNTTKYSLSSSQLKSLKGTNNIWSNAGPVEIKYWTH